MAKKQNCPFPLWFRHPAGRGLSHGYRQHAHKLVKIAHVVQEISWRTDRHTDVLITILRHRSCGWSNNSHVSAYRWRTKRVVERRIEQKRFQLMTKCIDTHDNDDNDDVSATERRQVAPNEQNQSDITFSTWSHYRPAGFVQWQIYNVDKFHFSSLPLHLHAKRYFLMQVYQLLLVSNFQNFSNGEQLQRVPTGFVRDKIQGWR